MTLESEVLTSDLNKVVKKVAFQCKYNLRKAVANRRYSGQFLFATVDPVISAYPKLTNVNIEKKPTTLCTVQMSSGKLVLDFAEYIGGKGIFLTQRR